MRTLVSLIYVHKLELSLQRSSRQVHHDDNSSRHRCHSLMYFINGILSIQKVSILDDI